MQPLTDCGDDSASTREDDGRTSSCSTLLEAFDSKPAAETAAKYGSTDTLPAFPEGAADDGSCHPLLPLRSSKTRPSPAYGRLP
eukprot:CAMPEP_0194339104 /NCGR_PEP_ID=MMETSP0171-20130528/81840_1 /TAXON_ID=218684 /ORGANISM="Corethron pennatum, Strain L29A3" /LENGTH=83 /DNA_ID=CAMNT_0039103503 /DNA_START=37 /DNA_END=284 /DNA_ORIENTATION=-